MEVIIALFSRSLMLLILVPTLTIAMAVGNPDCRPTFGDGINIMDCEIALNDLHIWYNEATAPHRRTKDQLFSRHYSPPAVDYRHTLPKAYRWASCAIGIDMADPAPATMMAKWGIVIEGIGRLVGRCVSQHNGWGGRLIYGAFDLVVTQPASHVATGTCLAAPNPITVSLGTCVQRHVDATEQIVNSLNAQSARIRGPPAGFTPYKPPLRPTPTVARFGLRTVAPTVVPEAPLAPHPTLVVRSLGSDARAQEPSPSRTYALNPAAAPYTPDRHRMPFMHVWDWVPRLHTDSVEHPSAGGTVGATDSLRVDIDSQGANAAGAHTSAGIARLNAAAEPFELPRVNPSPLIPLPHPAPPVGRSWVENGAWVQQTLTGKQGIWIKMRNIWLPVPTPLAVFYHGPSGPQRARETDVIPAQGASAKMRTVWCDLAAGIPPQTRPRVFVLPGTPREALVGLNLVSLPEDWGKAMWEASQLRRGR